MAEILALGADKVQCVEPLVGRYLTMLDDCRTLTLETIKSMRYDLLYWRRSQFDSNISDLLYHIALVEADWLYVDVLESTIPAELDKHLAYEDRDAQGRLVHIGTEELEASVDRMRKVRASLNHAYSSMDMAEFRRLRKSARREVSPEWVLHHLLQHEAEHRGQINLLKRLGTESERAASKR
jgi:uncharacterized damage-inducible protein DinB